MQQFARKIAHHGTHIERHVSNVRNHNQAFGVIWLIFSWVECEASCCYCRRILIELIVKYKYSMGLFG